MTIAIDQLDAPAAASLRPGLTDLLVDAVADGASVGFLHPLSPADADAYWSEVFNELAAGRRLLFVARDGNRVMGSVQLDIPARPNAAHRAEVQKLLVHTTARRRGLGTMLMSALEEAAAARGRYLLVLDTRAGDAAGRLYEKLGYVRAGVIPGYARSSSGRLHGTAIYYRDLRDTDAHLLGDTDAAPRWDPEPML
ncbi:MAG TPA: GNAT family N-acetyltransferase [Gemmataceae bacterium]|nr:GNAT family N-acetyltransferase [Gemmataceae bacterium]